MYTSSRLFDSRSDCILGKNEEQLPQPTVGRLSANSRPTVGRQSADSWLLANCRPTVVYLLLRKSSANSRPTVGRLSADCRPTVGSMSVICWPSVGRLLVNSRPIGWEPLSNTRKALARREEHCISTRNETFSLESAILFMFFRDQSPRNLLCSGFLGTKPLSIPSHHPRSQEAKKLFTAASCSFFGGVY